MPAITVDDTLVLPRIPRPDPTLSRPRPVAYINIFSLNVSTKSAR